MKRRRTCVVKPKGWRRKVQLKKSRKENSLKELREKMKISRKILTELWNQALDFTPILNLTKGWQRKSSAKSGKETKQKYRDAYFYKPKRRLVFGKNKMTWKFKYILLTYIVFYFKYVFLFFKYFQSSARRRTQGLFNADWETSKLNEKYYRSVFCFIYVILSLIIKRGL